MSKDHPQNFPKSLRLLRPAEFARVSKTGKRRFSKSFVLIVAERPQDCEIAPEKTADLPRVEPGAPRLGITVSRKVGKAVVRNRIKRGIREWFRRHRIAIPSGIDYLVIARKDASERSARQRAAELNNLFEGPAK